MAALTGASVDSKEGTLARAKQTDRAEARRRYRRSQTEVVGDEAELKPEERGSDLRTARQGSQAARDPGPPSGRPGFGSAMRGAYHPAHVREDLRHLPMLLRSRAFLAGALMVLVGAVVVYIFPNYTGSAMAWELLVWPGSALAPQLVAGFFAPRASYILGFLVGLIQGVVFTIFLTQFSSRLGAALPTSELGNLLSVSFLTGPLLGALFASMAAWYRRFLALSGPRRTSTRGQGRAPTKGAPSRRPAGR
jgi:hypothetical protein